MRLGPAPRILAAAQKKALRRLVGGVMSSLAGAFAPMSENNPAFDGGRQRSRPWN
jgi:hypothetical protein